ncbi:hypothetical protein [Flavobacterium sp.]|uniref:hypothetical protein n=1 Tax=Flavobacterium sp. TaxID=239 RepID=UPI001B731EFE|nr:hypothetical protein [Flavobacterium sp.]MBP6127862.1 hypothetical protein [Flavobacterium sp.]
MKKIFFLLTLVSIIFTGCSSEDDSNNSPINNEISMKFEIEGGLKFTSKIPNTDLNEACGYSSYINNNGSKTHEIIGLINREGSNPLYLQDAIMFSIKFTTSGDLQTNQIIQMSGINSFSVFLPYKSEDNYSQTSNACNSLQLEQKATSTGFVKITQITSNYIFGEFQLNNLLNVGGTNIVSGNPCPNYPNQQNYNLINGTFQALK